MLIRKLALVLAICTAAGSAASAIASGIIAAAQENTVEQTSPSPSQSPNPTASTTPLPSAEPLDESIWRDGIVNILFIGTDELYGENDKGRGDVTMLCSLNKKEGSIKLISFERSIGMPWPEHGDVMLTNTYAYGGSQLVCQDISRCFKVEIDGYVQMDFDGFSAIIDSMGGVDIYLDAREAQALTEDLYYEQSFTEGDCHLDGQAALRYARLRRIDDNWRRVERQRNVVHAVMNNVRNLRFAQIKELALLAAEKVDTDLTKAQLLSLVISAPRFIKAQPQQLTIPDRNNVWTYNSGEETVTGCDFGAESRRLNEFIYGTAETQPVMAER